MRFNTKGPIMKQIIAVFLCFIISETLFAENLIHTISVNGISETAVDPNMLVLQIESWGKASSAKSAQDLQATQYGNLKTVVEKFKIKKEDFATTNYSLNPEYFYDQKTQNNKVIGYRVSHQLSIIFRTVAESGKLIDALTAYTSNIGNQNSNSGTITNSAGVNVQNISWDYDKKDDVEKSAIATAVKLAREKAESLAKAAGVKIKAVHHIQHVTGYAQSQNFAPQEMRASKSMSADLASTELSSGAVKVRVEVQIDFEI